MGTSLTTTNFGLRYPAGLIGDAPDVPDDIRKLAQDADGWLGPMQSWTPTFTSSAGTFSAGSSPAYQCRYALSGSRFLLLVRVDLGSGASLGTGAVSITNPPVNMLSGSTAQGIYLPASASYPIPLTVWTPNSTSIRIDVDQASSQSVTRLSSLANINQQDRIAFVLAGFRGDI